MPKAVALRVQSGEDWEEVATLFLEKDKSGWQEIAVSFTDTRVQLSWEQNYGDIGTTHFADVQFHVEVRPAADGGFPEALPAIGGEELAEKIRSRRATVKGRAQLLAKREHIGRLMFPEKLRRSGGFRNYTL